MNKVCGWCKKPLSQEESPQDNDTSTGICWECVDFFKKNRKNRTFPDFLEDLPAPVVVLNSDQRIEYVNEKACSLLKRDYESFHGNLTGDALQCAHARLPGGCGHTQHCKACTIRITVMKTLQTGEKQEGITTPLSLETPEGPKEGQLKITTIKHEGLIYLRIDQYLTAQV